MRAERHAGLRAVHSAIGRSNSAANRAEHTRNSTRPGYEASLQRTPEQEAAQEALSSWFASAGRAIRRRGSSSSSRSTAYLRDLLPVYRVGDRRRRPDAGGLPEAISQPASFDVERGSFQTWITTLARNLLVDHFRRTRLERARTRWTRATQATTTGDAGWPVGRPASLPEAHASGMELKVRIQQALRNCAELRERWSARPGRYGLQGDCAVLRIPKAR